MEKTTTLPTKRSEYLRKLKETGFTHYLLQGKQTIKDIAGHLIWEWLVCKERGSIRYAYGVNSKIALVTRIMGFIFNKIIDDIVDGKIVEFGKGTHKIFIYVALSPPKRLERFARFEQAWDYDFKEYIAYVGYLERGRVKQKLLIIDKARYSLIKDRGKKGMYIQSIKDYIANVRRDT